LHEIPHRAAPATLERRVLVELERRAVQPWWRKDFLYWPVLARLAFLVASAGVVRWVLGAPDWVRESALVDLPPQISWIQATANAIVFVVDHLPGLVVYGGLAVLVLLYVAFFGIGAIAYRSLYANHS
ncbi:MAG: hypothetical protein ACREV5_18740, partial [Steroidobacter sp.]